MPIGRYRWGFPRYDTLVRHGDPANRLDIAILGDGYAADDMPLFYRDVDAIVQAFHNIEPVATYIHHFNFHRVNVISAQSGVTDGWANPPVRVRSALGAHFSFLDERRLVGWDWRVRQVARRSGVPYDALLVVVNTPRRGGATAFWMAVGYASRNSADFPHIMIHEAGHSIAKLADEYDYSLPELPILRGRSLPFLRLPFANVAAGSRKLPWQAWVAPGTPLPTPPNPDTIQGVVGAFEGASYMKYGLYRPTADCMMRRHSQPFCPVCQEAWIDRIYRVSRPADRFAPQGNPVVKVGEVVTFSADLVRPAAPDLTTLWQWRWRDNPWQVAAGAAGSPTWQLSVDRPGRWEVSLTLTDRNPRLRRPDVIARTVQQHTWQLYSV
jgi:hypothetical protein